MNNTKFNGIILCLILALPAWKLGKILPLIGGPVFGIIIGVIVGLILKDRTKFSTGIAFTSKKVLQYAVILLGFGLNLQTIISVGKTSLPIIIASITTSLLVAYVLAKVLKIPRKKLHLSEWDHQFVEVLLLLQQHQL